MTSDIIQLLTDIGGVGVATFALFLFWKIILVHKDEAKEWREDIKEGRKETNAVLKELTSVIKDINNRKRRGDG